MSQTTSEGTEGDNPTPGVATGSETGPVNRANIVLTGPPTSGTTLACRLLNTLPDTVALHDPIAPGRFADAEDGVPSWKEWSGSFA